MRIFQVLVLCCMPLLFANDAVKLRVAKLPAVFKPVKALDVSLIVVKGRVVAKLKGGKMQDLGPWDKADIEPAVDELVFGDFNFDGTTDVGVLEGVGYNGVNLFYRIYLYEKILGKLVQFKTTVSNPAVHTAQKLLISAQRSGPRWYQTIYRSEEGTLVRVYEAEMLNHPTLWGVSEYDAKDNLVGQRVLDAEALERNPATKKAPVRRLKTGECSDRLRAQKNGEGLNVEVLDFRDGGESIKVKPPAAADGIWINVDCLAEE